MANKYLHQHLIPDAGVETSMYVAPEANTGILRSLRVTNAGTSPATITVSYYDDNTGSPYYLLRGKSLTVNSTIDVFNGVPCVFEEGDGLRVTSSTGNVHFFLSYLEVDRN